MYQRQGAEAKVAVLETNVKDLETNVKDLEAPTKARLSTRNR